MAPPSHRHPPSRWLPLMVLLGLAALIAAQRLHTYHEPLEWDITIFAVTGHELLAGRSLYAEVWDHKPPAIFPTFAAAEVLAGYGPGAIFLLGLSAALATLLGAYAAGSALRGNITTGLWAGAFWTVTHSDPGLRASQPYTEVFINVCLIWAFALLVRADNRAPTLWRYLVIGALLALASLYKTTAIFIAIALGAAHLAFPPGGPQARGRALIQVLAMSLVGVAAWMAVGAYFAARGSWGVFYDTVFSYSATYAGSMLASLLKGLKPQYLMPRFLQFSWPLAGLAGLGLGFGLAKGDRRPWMLLLALAVGIQLAISLPAHFFPYYYQLWLPPLAVAAAWALEELGRRPLGAFSWLPRAVGATALIILVIHALPLYTISAEDWSRRKAGDRFIATREMGRELNALLQSGETFYSWGFDPGLYFYSRCRPPSGVFFSFPLQDGPLASTLTRRVLTDLERAPPELFVAMAGDDSLTSQPRHPVLAWLFQRYRPFSLQGAYLLFVRRGGRLEGEFSPGKRLASREALARENRVLKRIKAEYLTIKPKGDARPVSEEEFIKTTANVKKAGSKYVPADITPPNPVIFLRRLDNIRNIKGISWKCTARSNARIFYLFEGENNFSRRFSDAFPKNHTGDFFLNIELLEKVFGRKLITVRIDPTFRMEPFELGDFKIYQ